MTKSRLSADSTGTEKRMKRIIITAIVFVSVCIVYSGHEVFARESDPFKFPQVGFWIGPVTPVYTTRDTVDTAIGGGLFARLNLGNSPFKIGFDGSYQKYKSKSLNQITMFPVYGSLLYRIPISSMLSFQLKGGAGGAYVKAYPINIAQWDPMFMGGAEMSFPLGTMAAIGLRVDYLMIYEKHISGTKRNGHFLNTGLSINFNLDLFGR